MLDHVYQFLEKIDNLIIQNKFENVKTSPYAVTALYFLFILYGKPWDIQDMKICLQQPENVP